MLFSGLDDAESLEKAASEHDIVIHAAAGWHTGSAQALLRGLALRKQSGHDVLYIHTSGTSNVAERLITGKHTELRQHSDKDDIYGYELEREREEVYLQRTTDLAVVESGIKSQIKTHILMSPLIWGPGRGLFNQKSEQVAWLIRGAIKLGKAFKIGDVNGSWSHVQIEDLARLYEIMLAKLLRGEDIPHSKHGIYFSENGAFSWAQLAEAIAKHGKDLGALRTDEVAVVNLEKASNLMRATHVSDHMIELVCASHSVTRSDLARDIGWKPKHGTDEFFADVRIVWDRIYSEK